MKFLSAKRFTPRGSHHGVFGSSRIQQAENLVDYGKRNTASYCVCLSTRLDRCKEENDCDSYAVDADNYISNKDDTIFEQIANNGNGTVFNLYITNSKINIKLHDFKNAGNTVNFIIADPEFVSATLELKSTFLSSSSPENKFAASFQGISEVKIDDLVSSRFVNLTLKNSPLEFDESSLDIDYLITDTASLASTSSGIINVVKELTLNKATSTDVKLRLAENASLLVNQASLLPVLSFSDQNILGLSDSDEDKTIKIELKGSNSIKIFDDSASKVDISFYNREASTENNLTINFYFFVPYDGMGIAFQPARTGEKVNKYPNGFKFHFESGIENEDEIKESLLQLSLAEIPDSSYPLANIESNFNLQLMTRSTVSEFLKSLMKNEFEIKGLSSLILNIEDYLNEISFNETDINFILKPSGIASINKSVSDAFIIITSSEAIRLSIEDNSTIHRTSIITEKESNIYFDDSFINKSITAQLNNGEKIENISIIHGSLPVTLSSSYNPSAGMEYLPIVTLDQQITNVSYNNSFPETETIEIKDQGEVNRLRAGPKVTYDFKGNSINFKQEVGLAEQVAFIGNRFIFIYENESITEYEFYSTLRIIVSTSSVSAESDIQGNDNKISMKAATFFEGSSLNQDEKNGKSIQKLNATFGRLSCRHIGAIPSNSFAEPIKIGDSFEMIDDKKEIKQIYFTEDSVRFENSAEVRQLKSETPFVIKTKQSEEITMTFEGVEKKTLSNIKIFLEGSKSALFVDKTWYKVNISDTFKIFVPEETSELMLKTELLEFPKFRFYTVNGNKEITNFQIEENKTKFTSTKAFYILIGVIAAVLVIFIVSMITGYCLLKKKKEIADFTDQAEEAGLMEG